MGLYYTRQVTMETLKIYCKERCMTRKIPCV